MELAELAQNYFGNTRSGSLAGPIGAFVIAALAVTTVLLIRNMNSRIRRLPARFDGPAEGGEGGPGAGPGTGQAAAADGSGAAPRAATDGQAAESQNG